MTKKTNQKRKRKGRKKPKLDPVRYWGDPQELPYRNDYELDAPDPSALVRSLGRAPIPGKNSAPELYFDTLYKRASSLAQALSFAGGLNTSELPVKPNELHEDNADDVDESETDEPTDTGDDTTPTSEPAKAVA